jgi:Protein of unknown function (DUF2505)
MKRVHHTLTYPDATAADVFGMLTDVAYRNAVSAYQKVSDFFCEITPKGDGAEVEIEQAHSTDRIPSAAKRFLGEEIRFRQRETWSGPAAAVVHVTVPGKPGDMKGTFALLHNGSDVVQQIDLNVSVSIPLVGGKIEDMIADFILRVFDAQNSVGVKWLRGEWQG